MIDCFFYYIVDNNDSKNMKAVRKLWEDRIKEAQKIRDTYESEETQKWLFQMKLRNSLNYINNEQ